MGKTIRIYLANDNMDGLKTVEISNGTVKATVFSRPLLREFSHRSEASRPGVYMLYGYTANENTPMLYIGEGDPVGERLKDHGNEKDFWTEAFVFTAKDDYFTKTQIKFLESKLIKLAKEADRISLNNVQFPNVPTISEADQDEAEEFLEMIQLIIKVLHLDFFEEMSWLPIEPVQDELIYEYKTKKAVAKMAIRNGKYVILSGSTVVKECMQSITASVGNYRDKLINDEILKAHDDDLYIAVKDIPFNSSSYAAAIIYGGSVSGPIVWKCNGKTLKEMESEE